MKTIKITVYKFDELSKRIQQLAIEKLYGINVDYAWWGTTYEDAKTIGLEIESFELDRNRHCSGGIMYSGNETSNLILENHGEKCQTTALAIGFRSRWDNLVSEFSDGVKTDEVTEENEQEFDEKADELEKEFENDLLSEYANILQKESEYLMSEEAIIESIKANDYDFTDDGEIYLIK